MGLLLEERRQKRRKFLILKPEVTGSSLVDSSADEEALKLAQEKHRSDNLKIAAKQRKDAETVAREALVAETTRLEWLRHEANSMDLHLKWYTLSDIPPRPLAFRRRIASVMPEVGNRKSREQ